MKSNSQTDTWLQLNVETTSVQGTEIIQACIVFEQGTIEGSSFYDDGSIYIDAVAFYDCENTDCQQLENDKINLLREFKLSAIYPNPFNPLATIKYEVPNLSHVSIKIYDLSGREVVQLLSGEIEPGYHTISWNASDFSSGLYFVKMQADRFIQKQKIMLIK